MIHVIEEREIQTFLQFHWICNNMWCCNHCIKYFFVQDKITYIVSFYFYQLRWIVCHVVFLLWKNNNFEILEEYTYLINEYSFFTLIYKKNYIRKIYHKNYFLLKQSTFILKTISSLLLLLFFWAPMAYYYIMGVSWEKS